MKQAETFDVLLISKSSTLCSSLLHGLGTLHAMVKA